MRLWIENARRLALEVDDPGTRRFHEQKYFFDFEWQRLVFDPPLPVARRADRRWLIALLGGAEERVAMGADAPPLLDEVPFGENLLWGWPSAVLFRLAFAAARDAIDACAPTLATAAPEVPPTRLLASLARIEEAAARGEASVDDDPIVGLELAPARWSRARDAACRYAVQLPERLARMLPSYQGTRRAASRPAAAADVVRTAARTKVELGWTAHGFSRSHARKTQAVRFAAAAALRAEKAQRALESRPPRLEVYGLDASRAVADLTRRRDRARALAAEAKAKADALVAECPAPPSYEDELRALLGRIAPALVAWLRTESDFEPVPLIVNHIEIERGAGHGAFWRITYAEDGRVTTSYAG